MRCVVIEYRRKAQWTMRIRQWMCNGFVNGHRHFSSSTVGNLHLLVSGKAQIGFGDKSNDKRSSLNLKQVVVTMEREDLLFVVNKSFTCLTNVRAVNHWNYGTQNNWQGSEEFHSNLLIISNHIYKVNKNRIDDAMRIRKIQSNPLIKS